MVRLKKSSLIGIYGSIMIAFKEDKALFTKYHILAEHKLSSSVNVFVYHTFKSIEQSSKDFDFSYYIVYNNETEIGFLVLCEKPGGKFIYSFGININFRLVDVLKDFFALIVEKFEEKFKAYLWDKNTRAISFLEKCGMKKLEQRDSIEVLIYNI